MGVYGVQALRSHAPSSQPYYILTLSNEILMHPNRGHSLYQPKNKAGSEASWPGQAFVLGYSTVSPLSRRRLPELGEAAPAPPLPVWQVPLLQNIWVWPSHPQSESRRQRDPTPLP